MDIEIIPPTRRSCERCGRADIWNEQVENWVIVEEDGEKRAGNRHCIHEWDINGQYSPIGETTETDA